MISATVLLGTLYVNVVPEILEVGGTNEKGVDRSVGKVMTKEPNVGTSEEVFKEKVALVKNPLGAVPFAVTTTVPRELILIKFVRMISATVLLGTLYVNVVPGTFEIGGTNEKVVERSAGKVMTKDPKVGAYEEVFKEKVALVKNPLGAVPFAVTTTVPVELILI
jgi:archaellum component FlaF (FlaF/FlaG flagellin family)